MESQSTTLARRALLSQFRWESGHADIWRVFDDGAVFNDVVDALVEPWRAHRLTKVVGIEARGFILGGAASHALGVGFVAIRKPGGLFPGPKHEVEAMPDYREQRHALRLQQRSVGAADRLLLVDDWIERGSQARAAVELVARCGATIEGITVIVDQLDDESRADLPPVTSIIRATDLPVQ